MKFGVTCVFLVTILLAFISPNALTTAASVSVDRPQADEPATAITDAKPIPSKANGESNDSDVTPGGAYLNRVKDQVYDVASTSIIFAKAMTLKAVNIAVDTIETVGNCLGTLEWEKRKE